MAGFFGFNSAPGPGVRKDEPEKKGLARYFEILGKRFWRLVSLNFLYFLFSIIPLLLMWVVCSFSVTWTVSLKLEADKVADWLNNGGTLLTVVFVMLIYCSCGGGPAACGLINVLRSYVSDSHAWVWQDFWTAFKRSLVKGSVAYIIDCLSVGVLIINYGFYNVQTSGILNAIMTSLLYLVAFIWSMMHVYIYPIMTSFDLSLGKIYKNSFLMVLAKLPQTLAALALGFIASFIVVYFSVGVIYVALIIPIILFAFCEYTRLYISYPLIKSCIAEPSAPEPGPEGEAVFRDEEVAEK